MNAQTKGWLTGLGIAGGTILAGYITIRIVQRSRDENANDFLKKLDRMIDWSGTGGIEQRKGFDITYADRISGTKNVIRLQDRFATEYAKKIKKAWGFLDDDEEDIYAVFRKLKDEVQISQVAKSYQRQAGNNMIDDMKNKLSTSELSKVLVIIENYPPYRLVA